MDRRIGHLLLGACLVGSAACSSDDDPSNAHSAPDAAAAGVGAAGAGDESGGAAGGATAGSGGVGQGGAGAAGGTSGEPASNLVVNGTFDTDASGWSAERATLSVENGALRIEVSEAELGRPGVAYQIVPVTSGADYRVTARMLEATYVGNSYVRVGTGINDATYGEVRTDTPELVFTATSDEVTLTLNTVAGQLGEFALFDDITMVEVP